jgi:hypothetical protein
VFRAMGARGIGGEPLPFTAVKADVKGSPGLSLSMYGFWELSTDNCKTADIVCSVSCRGSLSNSLGLLALCTGDESIIFLDKQMHRGRRPFTPGELVTCYTAACLAVGSGCRISKPASVPKMQWNGSAFVVTRRVDIYYSFHDAAGGFRAYGGCSVANPGGQGASAWARCGRDVLAARRCVVLLLGLDSGWRGGSQPGCRLGRVEMVCGGRGRG